jgi:hypothetical protein
MNESEKKIVFVILSVLLAFGWEILVFRSGLSFGTPGMYIVHSIFRPHYEGGPSLGTLWGVMLVIDSLLCFLLICLAKLTFQRLREKRQSDSGQ